MIRKSLALAICLTGAQLSMAQGFYVDEQSALRLGDAFVTTDVLSLAAGIKMKF